MRLMHKRPVLFFKHSNVVCLTVVHVCLTVLCAAHCLRLDKLPRLSINDKFDTVSYAFLSPHSHNDGCQVQLCNGDFKQYVSSLHARKLSSCLVVFCPTWPARLLICSTPHLSALVKVKERRCVPFPRLELANCRIFHHMSPLLLSARHRS